jgi:hypothetical protein
MSQTKNSCKAVLEQESRSTTKQRRISSLEENFRKKPPYNKNNQPNKREYFNTTPILRHRVLHSLAPGEGSLHHGFIFTVTLIFRGLFYIFYTLATGF